MFAGTPDFAVPTLAGLASSTHEVVAVYTQPDRPAGRGRQLRASPVKEKALSLGLPVLQPGTLREQAQADQLVAFQPDVFVVVAYGLLLPQRVLDIPRLGCINVHASVLPRWRGAAPIQRAIEAGDTQSGVSIMAMEAGLDTGPVYAVTSTALAPDETGGSLHDRLSEIGAQALLEALPQIATGELQAQPQDDAGATYARRLSKQEGRLDWTLSAQTLSQRIRAFNPWPVAYAEHAGERMRIWNASVSPMGAPADAQPGTVLAASAQGIDVLTGNGVLRVLQLQLPGKRALSAGEFLNATPLLGASLS